MKKVSLLQSYYNYYIHPLLHPEPYVDMQPTNKIEEENEELSTPLRPYLRI